MNMIKYTVYTAFILQLILGSAICLAEPEDAVKPQEPERVTLNFRESPIQDVFEILSRKDKVNIILDKAVNGVVSVSLYDISVRDAIYRVAEAAGYAVEVRNGDYFILDRKDVGMDHPSGLTQLRTFKVQYSDPKQVAEILTKYLSRHGKITPLNDRRMIVIEDTPEFLERFSKLLQEVDAQPKQILIEARVLEITLDDGETYGVDWSRIFGSAPGANGVFGTNGLASGSVSGGPVAAGFFYSLTNKNLEVFLEAKATKNRVRTLSSPKLLAMENKEAKAVIGNSTGYKVTTTINQVTTESVQFLESGVILRVTPSVDQLGRVMLKVHPEVSSATLNAGIPDKKSTEVTTELICEDGEAVFIGGLIKKNSSSDIVGVPFLSSIPLIGHLFSKTAETVSNTETVVIITPRIVQNQRTGDESALEKIKQIEQDSGLTLDYKISQGSTSLSDKMDISAPE
jgi:type II secretory pathway component GspD/PulD (secretin)